MLVRHIRCVTSDGGILCHCSVDVWRFAVGKEVAAASRTEWIELKNC